MITAGTQVAVLESQTDVMDTDDFARLVLKAMEQDFGAEKSAFLPRGGRTLVRDTSLAAHPPNLNK